MSMGETKLGVSVIYIFMKIKFPDSFFRESFDEREGAWEDWKPRFKTWKGEQKIKYRMQQS